jgi:Na+-translocating ferredoxin:NAD+ oxidoreductase RnfG subunit
MRITTLSAGTALVLTLVGAQAERYLSVEEVQRVCFPQANLFEAQVLRLTADQSKSIEEKAHVRVRSSICRIWFARNQTNLLGVLVVDQVLGKHELIDYAVAISQEGKVQQVEILEYRENYGSRIRDAKWREQFKGKSAGAKLSLNDDIYNISGATISCRSVTEGVRRVLAMFELVVRPQLVGSGRLPDAAARP